MRMTRMTCVLALRAFLKTNLAARRFYHSSESSLQTRVPANFEVGFRACFMNDFIVILKLLYMHVRFEVGFEACFLNSLIVMLIIL